MQQDTGRIFDNDAMKNLFAKDFEETVNKEIGKKFSRFAVGEHISWKNCDFIILEIKTDPINQIILQGVEK